MKNLQILIAANRPFEIYLIGTGERSLLEHLVGLGPGAPLWPFLQLSPAALCSPAAWGPNRWQRAIPGGGRGERPECPLDSPCNLGQAPDHSQTKLPGEIRAGHPGDV